MSCFLTQLCLEQVVLLAHVMRSHVPKKKKKSAKKKGKAPAAGAESDDQEISKALSDFEKALYGMLTKLRAMCKKELAYELPFDAAPDSAHALFSADACALTSVAQSVSHVCCCFLSSGNVACLGGVAN